MYVKSFTKKFPVHGYIGLLLIIVFWNLNWSLSGLRTHWGFFPLWLGYCLTVDAIVYFRKGSSMIKRNFMRYISLFLISEPCWWLFELFNHVLHNWRYMGREFFSDTDYFLLASLSFSTVMPAVFGTSELVSTFSWFKNYGSQIKSKKNQVNYLGSKILLLCFVSGWVFLFLLLFWPEHFFYLIWISVYLIIDPLNYYLNKPSLLYCIEKGNWKPIQSLWIGILICAFFWEMWNYNSYPKWVYHLPIADFLHIFEMPALGYIGYVPFSMELFALYSLITGKEAYHFS